jgi:hypothetical protein
MDDARFDRLARSFVAGSAAGSRRSVLAGLASGILVSLPLSGDQAVAKKKRKKGKKKKRPRPAAPVAPLSPSGCIPSCGNKVCGPDGCDGSCGTCSGGTCSPTGVCDCGSGKEPCQGECRDACPTDAIRLPGACTCCKVNGTARPDVGLSACVITCCSGKCTPVAAGGFTCTGLARCDPCIFDEQCADEVACQGGRCGGFTTFCSA